MSLPFHKVHLIEGFHEQYCGLLTQQISIDVNRNLLARALKRL